jgi:hypothetical protein
METRTIEDLIWLAAEDERKRGPAGLSFAPVYSFVSAVAHMARGQERQAIIDAVTKARPKGKSAARFRTRGPVLEFVAMILFTPSPSAN